MPNKCIESFATLIGTLKSVTFMRPLMQTISGAIPGATYRRADRQVQMQRKRHRGMIINEFTAALRSTRDLSYAIKEADIDASSSVQKRRLSRGTNELLHKWVSLPIYAESRSARR